MKDARVLLVGLGGLGCPAAIALARAGVGTLGLLDDDTVATTNLHRQLLFREEDVGTPKIDAAARALEELAPVRIERHFARLLPQIAVDLVREYDVVVEGADNFPTKFLAADACRLAGRPVVHASAVRWHGTALAATPGGPCYRCLFEDVPDGVVPNCEDAGVIGPMVGVVAAAQADFALALLAGRDVGGSLFTFDGKDLNQRRWRIRRRADCRSCAGAIDDVDYARYARVRCDAS